VNEAMVLDNTKTGGGLILTTELKKRMKNLYASVAYTYNGVKDLTGNPGSQAASTWSNNRAVGSLNNLPLAYSEFAVPHRVIGALNYKFDYANSMSTTVSMFYEGSNQYRFSYVYNGDLNQDGINGADLLYIPANPSEIMFGQVLNADKTVKYTAQQQSDAFFAYVDQDKYLSKNKGEYVDRNSALAPWLNRIDFRVMQDFYINAGSKKNTLQVSLDILNVANLLNSSWGVLKRNTVNNGAILRYTKLDASGQPLFNMVEVGGKFPTTTFENLPTVSSVWGAQLGIRYIFN
jgi:hypothetical protein